MRLTLCRMLAVTALVAAMVPAFPPRGVVAAEAGLIAHWAFDEAAGASLVDSSGNGHDGSFAGQITRIPGIYGGALRLHSASTSIVVPGAEALEPEHLTISMWVRGDPEEPPANGAVLIENGVRGCHGPSYGLYVAGDSVELRLNYSGNRVGFVAASGPSLWDGSWHHVSLTYTSVGSRWAVLYIDGHNSGHAGWLIDYSGTSSDDLTIGGSAAKAACGFPAFIGDIDDVRLYDRDLDRETLGALEPPIPTVTVLSPRAGVALDVPACFTATVEPVPVAGRVRLIELRPDESEVDHGLDATSWCSYPNPAPPAGTYLIPARFRTKGDIQLVARFVPGKPWQASESDIVTQPVAGIATRTIVDVASSTPGESIVVSVGVSGQGARIEGSVSLYDTTGDREELLGSSDLVVLPGHSIGSADFVLPGRALGTYRLVARYPGTDDVFDASSAEAIVQVVPPVTGPVEIEGGATATRDSSVEVAVPSTGATHVGLSNDGATWTTRPYGAVQPWVLPAGNGPRVVYARWRDWQGNWSAPKSDSIILDAVVPSATGPVHSFAAGSALNSDGIPVRLSWTGSDLTSGIARYQLRKQTDGGPWTTVISTLSTTSLMHTVEFGHTYRFAVRAIDEAGNVGSFAYGSAFRALGYQHPGAVVFGGTWRTGTSASYWGGSAAYSTSTGSTASFEASGRQFALVASRGPARGKATILQGSTVLATIDLYSATTQHQRIVWSREWTTSARRTITVRVSGTAGRPTVIVDGFVVIP